MASDPSNDFRSGDLDNNLLRKILARMIAVMGSIETVTPTVVIEPGNVNIGSVTIKDADGADLVDVETAAPAAGKAGLVVRNIPSGTQTVTGTVNVGNLPVTQPVSGTVAVSNFPATQPVSGAVLVSNFPATQPVSGTVAVSNFPANQVVSDPTDIVNPAFAAARLGLVDGHAAEVFHVMGRRSGFNSTSVLQDIGEFLGTSINALPELTGAENLEVVSTSTSDDASPAGTGARTVRVGYIDTSNNLTVSADISLDGTTPVALAFKANFILWMETTSVGANEVAVGNVLLRIAGGGATQEQITAGGNRSLSCRFMVPTGYKGYILDWGNWAIGTTQDSRLRATVRTRSRTLGTDYVFQSIAYLAAGGNTHEELPYFQCPALSKIKVSTIPGAAPAGNRIDSEFTILLIAD